MGRSMALTPCPPPTRSDYDNFDKRAYTAKWEKLAMLPRAYLRVKAPELGL